MPTTRQLVREAKRRRINRAYYEKCWNIKDIRQAGLVQTEAKCQLERVQLAANTNELLYLFGLDASGSRFELHLGIVSLYPEGQAAAESRWRLACLDFKLELVDKQAGVTSYSYSTQQLLDYDEKRRHAHKHEQRNIYKLGAMSIEQVLPFSFARILFTGLMRIKRPGEIESVQLPVRLAISTHPTCDKFDYSYRFNTDYTSRIIEKSLKPAQVSSDEKRRLLGQILEDRFDQPLMFQGHLEGLERGSSIIEEHFIMWGSKVKKFLDPRASLATEDDERDCLFAWTEFGIQIHLSRPVRKPNLVYGLIHNSYDYGSSLYDAKLLKCEVGAEKEVDFSELDSFSELTSSYKIQLTGFKKKTYTLEIGKNHFKPISQLSLFRVKINDFEGLALQTNLALGQQLRAAQQKLWMLVLNDRALSEPLADERLLGGKGHSLVQLAQLVENRQLASTHFKRGQANSQVRVTVPRGLVLTTRAYNLWLESSGQIGAAIEALDSLRRQLAAKSVHLNPMAKEYVSLSEGQRRLRAKCEETRQVLRAQPLPSALRAQLVEEMGRLFGREQLHETTGKLFAVRSSAVGEDSLETSAAGQMRTILDARGTTSICQAVVDCWSSQFELEALTYKSQNGLAFNLPMGVVVQELVACHAAGVAATCEPLTGNPRKLEITANFGLGEGVVSGGRTDTVRVHLDRVVGNGELSLPDDSAAIEQLGESCCLTETQIVALANLLLELRRTSAISEREVEWGLTLKAANQTESDSSSNTLSSSSSISSSSELADFQLHLLQSRPLTNLTRLTNGEIDHELDYGIPSARDVLSRANLAEVMPGALCPINSSFSMPVSSSYATSKPFERNHTRKMFVADSFGFYAQMAMMVVTYSDTLKRFAGLDGRDKETAKAVIYSMIGSLHEEPDSEEERELMTRFHMNKVNPGAIQFKRSFLDILAADSGGHLLMRANNERQMARTILHEDLATLDELAEANNQLEIKRQARCLYQRIISTTSFFCNAWTLHIESTLLSMAFNVICLKLLSSQPAYAADQQQQPAGGIIATEILNDFSVLMREPKPSTKLGRQTESGDIAKLLNQLLVCIVDEQLLERLKALKPAELYEFFTSKNETNDNFKCRQLYRDFMARNGHRANREFCFSTSTWSDDSSYVMRLLAMRLRNYTALQAQRDQLKWVEMEQAHAQKYAQVQAKVSNNRLALMRWAVPRARNATVRRERSKSLLIKATHKYRLAFRHLGGLLCLLGLLPSADLVYYLTIEELDEVMRTCCESSSSDEQRNSLMPRLLYKARRRQQRTRAYDQVKFPKPNLRFDQMVKSLREQVESTPAAAAAAATAHGAAQGHENGSETGGPNERVQVRGLISCAGCVTGRACVISSLDETDLLEPGDILITYSIDISWSVYFFALAGIVTEVGGIVSHGAVVAREYGIPTLCTALDATKKFRTGQRVTLDATKGVCYLVAEEQEAAAAATTTTTTTTELVNGAK